VSESLHEASSMTRINKCSPGLKW